MIDDHILNELPEDQQIEVVENTMKKDFTFSEKCAIIDATKPKLKEQATQRQKTGKPASDSDKGRTDEKISSYLGISRDKYHKILEIKNAVKENPEKFDDIPDRIDNGMSVEYAHKMISNVRKAETPTPNLPDEEYEIIYIDPPWAYDLQLTGSPPYKTMTIEQMKKEIPQLPAHKNSIVFMWVTNPKLAEGLELLNHWNFQYKTNIVWVKQKEGKLQQGTGYYVKGSHELLLIATRGSPGIPPESVRFSSVVFAERTSKHSEKPKIFYEIIEKMYPAKKKIELFSRCKRNDWESWGDEVDDRK